MDMTREKLMRPTRGSYRFRVQEPLQASFGAIPVSIRDLSENGIQIEHAEPLPRGFSGTLSYQIPGGSRKIHLHAELRWSKASDDRGVSTYRSGVTVDENTEGLSNSLDLFIRKGIAKLDRGKPESTPAPQPLVTYDEGNAAHGFVIADGRLAAEERIDELTFDEIRIIEQARERLASSFEESLRWYNRARYALAEESVQKAVIDIRHREDVLAVWEFLGRSLEIATIARAFDRRSY